MNQCDISHALDYIIWRIEGETDPEQIAELRIVKEALEAQIGNSNEGNIAPADIQPVCKQGQVRPAGKSD